MLAAAGFIAQGKLMAVSERVILPRSFFNRDLTRPLSHKSTSTRRTCQWQGHCRESPVIFLDAVIIDKQGGGAETTSKQRKETLGGLRSSS